jgi:hypothetical protein
LAVQVSGSDTTIQVADVTGWPDGAAGPFFLVVDRGSSDEEKMLVSSRVGTTLAIAQRGADGTSAVTHTIDAPVEHVWTATDADESNLHVNAAGAVHGLSSPVVGETDPAVLENKTLDGDSNVFRDIPSAAVTGLDAKQAAQDAAIASGSGALNTHKTSGDHDGRYYTEAESDARFVNQAGDTMTGDLGITANGPTPLRGGPTVRLIRPDTAGARWVVWVAGQDQEGDGRFHVSSEYPDGALHAGLAISREGQVRPGALAPVADADLTRKDYVDAKKSEALDAVEALRAEFEAYKASLGNPVQWAWGPAGYDWRIPNGNWTKAQGSNYSVDLVAGGVYLVTYRCMVYGDAATNVRSSLMVGGGVVAETSCTLNGQVVPLTLTHIVEAAADGPVEFSTAFASGVISAVPRVLGNAWASPYTQVSRIG